MEGKKTANVIANLCRGLCVGVKQSANLGLGFGLFTDFFAPLAMTSISAYGSNKNTHNM